MNSRKAALGITTVIALLIGLVVIIVSVGIIQRPVSTITDTCSNLNGVVALSCDEDYAQRVASLEDDFVCCSKIPIVSQEDFDEWARTAEVSPEPESSSTVRVASTTVPSGVSSISLNNLPYQQTPYVLESNESFTIRASHNIDDGDFCQLYIAKAYKTKDGWSVRDSEGRIHVVGSFSKKNSDCSPADEGLAQLSLEADAFLSGDYKADFIVREKEGDPAISSASLVFTVRSERTVDSDVGGIIAYRPAIDAELFSQGRNNEFHCFVDLTLDGEQSNQFRIAYELTDGSCDYAQLSNTFTRGQGIRLGPDQTACFSYSHPYQAIGATGMVSLNASYTAQNCDIITITDASQDTPVCLETCSSYRRDTQYKCSPTRLDQRASGCDFGLDCYWDARNFHIFGDGGTCRDCSDGEIEFCFDYDNQEACESNQCLPAKCQWLDNRCQAQ